MKKEEVKRHTLYVGVNQCWQLDKGDYFQVSSACLEDNEELKFTTEAAANAVESAISRAYYRGKREAKKELLEWIND